MKTERSQVGIGLRFWWMIAGVTGLGVGLGLLVALIKPLAPLSSILNSTTVVVMAGAVVGASLGAAQWLVLRRHLPRAGWWVLATFLGMAVGFALVNVNFDPMDIITPGFVVGAPLGTTQWLVLRRHIPRAGWWVLATLGFTVCFYSALAFAAMVVSAVAFYSGAPESSVLLTWFLVAVVVVGGALYGGITGNLLVHLLRQPNPDVSSPPEEAI